MACLGGGVLAGVLAGCRSAKMVTGAIVGDYLTVPLASFVVKGTDYRKYIIIHAEKLAFPICLYRSAEQQYTALYMRCTHQGAELQAFGDRLQCPAHGSEFNNKGIVQNGPADANLRTFPVTISNNQIKISLQ